MGTGRRLGRCLVGVLLVGVLGVLPVQAQGDGAPPIEGGPSRDLLVARTETDYTGGYVQSYYRLVMVSTDGSTRELVDPPTGPGRWSPDGSLIAYKTTTGVHIIRPDGGRPPGAAVDGSPLVADAGLGDQPWSPDGSRLLVVMSPHERPALATVVVDTGHVDVVLDDAGSVSGASWSPDGRHAAFLRFDDQSVASLLVLDLAGGDPIELATGVVGYLGAPKWSPDGTELAYALVDSGAVEIAEVATGEVRRPAVDPAGSQLHWTPSGDGLLYGTDRGLVVADVRPGSTRPSRTLDLAGTPHGFISPTRVLATQHFGDGHELAVELDLETGQVSYRTPVGYLTDVRIDPGSPDIPLSAAASRALRYSRMRADGSNPHVLLGTTADFADALASGGAQGALDAPLLLVDPDHVHQAVLDELRRLGTTRITLLGGPSALPQATEDDLRHVHGFTVDRLAGATRIDTAVAIATATHSAPTRVLLARAFGMDTDPTAAFADSLAGGAAAVAAEAPLLLTARDVLSPQVQRWLDDTPSVEEVVVLGGPAAVDPAVTDGLTARGLAVHRLAGPDRVATAAAVTAWARQATAGDDDPPPTDGVLVALDAFDPLAWSEGFAAALTADPSRGGGIVLVNTGVGIQPATAAPILDAPAGTDLLCGHLLALHACFDVSGVHGVAHSPVRATGRLTGEDDDVFGDVVVAEADGIAQCTIVAVEGAQIAAAHIGPDPDGLRELPAPGPDGRIIECTRYLFRTQPVMQDGWQVHVRTTDGDLLTGTLTYTGPPVQ